ncbi:hypothetical protein ACFYUL_14550 [Streptomyces sp. NPDC004311]|uniref:hypothetical protein n=1 Tax=Streptomyces sp. NPDC004311 TaxID=3364698 RepID=UPI0036A176E6
MSVSCSTAACRMPARSKDTTGMRRFAADHARAHARLAGIRPNADCSCGGAQCALHEARVPCGGSALLVLVHNAAVGQVWTLAEVCQACARQIPHTTVLATGSPAAAAPAPQGAVGVPPAPRAAVPGGFSSPEASPEPSTARKARRPQRPQRRRQG